MLKEKQIQEKFFEYMPKDMLRIILDEIIKIDGSISIFNFAATSKVHEALVKNYLYEKITKGKFLNSKKEVTVEEVAEAEKKLKKHFENVYSKNYFGKKVFYPSKNNVDQLKEKYLHVFNNILMFSDGIFFVLGYLNYSSYSDPSPEEIADMKRREGSVRSAFAHHPFVRKELNCGFKGGNTFMITPLNLPLALQLGFSKEQFFQCVDSKYPLTMEETLEYEILYGKTLTRKNQRDLFYWFLSAKDTINNGKIYPFKEEKLHLQFAQYFPGIRGILGAVISQLLKGAEETNFMQAQKGKNLVKISLDEKRGIQIDFPSIVYAHHFHKTLLSKGYKSTSFNQIQSYKEEKFGTVYCCRIEFKDHKEFVDFMILDCKVPDYYVKQLYTVLQEEELKKQQHQKANNSSKSVEVAVANPDEQKANPYTLFAKSSQFGSKPNTPTSKEDNCLVM